MSFDPKQGRIIGVAPGYLVGFEGHAPNLLQHIPLNLVEPSADNCRLFIERMSLNGLRSIYRTYKQDQNVMLPDAPILRFRGWKKIKEPGRRYSVAMPILEILAGERRITAATLEHVTHLPCRVVTMTDEEAYRFILAHNDVAGLTTVELAFRAVEMDRLGFQHDEISHALGGVALHRYFDVGTMIDPDWFTDEPKQCDPSIIEWFEAAQFGRKHFERCFKHWNAGLWHAKKCAKEFRRRGKALPIDNAEKGIRVTYDDTKFVVRGQIVLGTHTDEEAVRILQELRSHIDAAIDCVQEKEDTFGPRMVYHLNPETLQ